MIRDKDALSDKRWLELGPEQRRALQGLIEAIDMAEPELRSHSTAADSAQAVRLRDVLRWTELCRELGVLPRQSGNFAAHQIDE